MKVIQGKKVVISASLLLLCSQVSNAAQIVYEGSLVQGGSVTGQVAGSISNSADWSYWTFAARGGNVVTIAGHRQEASLDPAAGIFAGVYTDSTEIPGSIFSGLAAADDNMPELPGLAGPFSDPLIVFTVPEDGIYTYAIASYASAGPGADGVYDYSVELSGGYSLDSFFLGLATPAITDAMLYSQGREINSLLTRHIDTLYSLEKGFLSPETEDGITLWAVYSYKGLDFEDQTEFLGDADGARNTLYVGSDVLRGKSYLLGCALELGVEDAEFNTFEVEQSGTTIGAILYGAITLPYDLALYSTAGISFVQNDFDYHLLGMRFNEDYDTSRFLASIGMNKTIRFDDLRVKLDWGYVFSTESSENFTTSDGARFEKDSAKIGTARVALDVVQPVLASSEIYGSVIMETDVTRSYADEDSGAQLGAGFRTMLDPGVAVDLGGTVRNGDVSEYGVYAELKIEL